MRCTPGKWIIKYDFNVLNEKGRLIASCGGYSSNVNSDKVHDENVANSKLIAAAPDMYKALNHVCTIVCKPGMDCGNCGLSYIEKVLQKARGE